jgi:DNA-binding NarL/FixJ family response regulator
MRPKGQNLVLVAARPGILRNSLLSYLRALASVQAILIADDAATALQMVRADKPRLVVLDCDLSEDRVLDLIQRMLAEGLEAKSIVLAGSIQQQQLCLAKGATHALLKGLLDAPLKEAVLCELESIDS